MSPYRVTLIRGDGIGPEVTQAARIVLDATGIDFEWVVVDAGAEVMEKSGTPLPAPVIEAVRASDAAIKGPITPPTGAGIRSVNVALRRALDLYANLRPARTLPGVHSRYDNIDLVVVRENTEDLYSGIEFEKNSPQALEVIEMLVRLGGKKIFPRSGLAVKPISSEASERIARFAFEYARRNARRKVTAVHKANILKHTDGLFLEAARQVASEYPDVEFEDRIVDNLCMQLVQKPELFDVLVLPNLYGDIVSDLTAGLVGGLGVAPGANIGDRYAVFEAIHGSAPRYAGQNKVNPSALILSGALLLRHLGEQEAAVRVEQAVADVIAEGQSVTYDLAPAGSTPVGTRQMAEAIAAKVSA
ncbi:isocitrate/isopropylmalate dehydrogenase family protein [Gloeobacter morelensis]|uniref:Isocitrate/isopropylmalate dehydrogenase family protein n=1 Tax=Gloeobacter morelensis MG652769 TaxID=2781736 RepID=A0ABY3PH44_9CYAN|nr:isocitrate/isopropylmalate dehydrogenase family protein [Gloeobacter morelensis]UFP92985.1 isocitrate/isopropylmalate dehydrogenase family protein [Gloeobacter morelensis MG652769]